MHASVTASGEMIEWLGELQALESVGGKAASLDRLARAGFRIPPGFCVTTGGFRAHLDAVAAASAVRDALAALPDEAARTTVADAVRSAPLPAALASALDGATSRLGGDAARASQFAVRSSAIGEDGRAASFAGLHDTELGVAPGAVGDAVRRCWSSLWSREAIAYRERRGVSLAGAAMAVVVQALVPADAAAVVFTRHPVTGSDQEVVVTAVRGLGEPMVSGTTTPDTIVVDRASGAVIDFSPGDGGERLIATDAGVAYRPGAAGVPALADVERAELVHLALEVERAFGDAVDIEAALANGRWYLLQARPITA
ncbi:MAG TPA: PEP/pyruvate-binding domain-containing protein [Candidatus Limnocylindrales bacterium]|nr:PEP/pyruvate-binding domain-containing protein [Candidatus Limnocylindrales bacterium]